MPISPMISRRLWTLGAALAFAACAQAQSQPPIRILVGAPAGGTTDTMARTRDNQSTPLHEVATGEVAELLIQGKADVEGITIQFAVDSDGLDSELASGPNDSDGDLSTVGDQDLLQHGWQYLPNGCRRRHMARSRRPHRAPGLRFPQRSGAAGCSGRK